MGKKKELEMKESDKKPVRIISDHPEKPEKISFGFEHYIEILSELIANKENETPLVIGVYGDWGSGKTTLMRNIQDNLESKNYLNLPGVNKKWYRKCKTVWFEPWKYEKEDEILAALIETIFKTMQKDGFFKYLKSNFEKITKNVEVKGFFYNFIKKLTVGVVDLDKLFTEEEYKKKLAFYDNFDLLLNRLIFTYLSFGFQKEGQYEEWDDQKGSLVIFIDDLDRCPTERILKVLETIKLFMDKKGCVFVIGASKDIIIQAIKDKGFQEYGKKFMDKIVNVTFKLPKIHRDDFKGYLETIKKEFNINLIAYSEIIIPMMDNNPRNLKRFINDVNLRHKLAGKKGLQIKLKHQVIWEIISDNYPSLKEIIIKNKATGIFTKMREIIVDLKSKENPDIENLLKEIDEKNREFIKNPLIAQLIDGFDCNGEQIEKLETLRETFDSSEPEDKKIRTEKRDIGSMVLIPKGKFIYQDNQKKTITNPYEIGIYPVTHQEFERFVKDGGYKDEKYWEKYGGWEWKNKEGFELPYYWDNARFNGSSQPVVGVSFYEAKAYCEWLSEKTGKKYRLPKEKEWEKAARGTDGRQYPWGNEFDQNKCNSVESDKGKTTDVTLYPQGISPFGCYDMAGNVWEWCDSFYNEEERGLRVLRGGGWNVSVGLCRSSFRDPDLPEHRDFDIGFRLARSL